MMINGKYTNLDGRSIDRGDLEEKIMSAWQIVDDLKLTYSRIEGMNEDQLYGTIHGLEIFANMRMNDLWDTYEQCLHNGVFNSEHKRGEEIAKALDEAIESFGQEKL